MAPRFDARSTFTFRFQRTSKLTRKSQSHEASSRDTQQSTISDRGKIASPRCNAPRHNRQRDDNSDNDPEPDNNSKITQSDLFAHISKISK